MTEKRKIKIAHSPDTDDIFMFHALKSGLVSDPEFDFEITSSDVETLNQLASTQKYDITALSVHAYAHVAQKYALLSSGASMAEKDWGPSLVARGLKPLTFFSGKKIAVPGLLTTAVLVLKMMLPDFKPVPMLPEKILPAVKNGEVDAGLLIHEGQIQYTDFGLHRVVQVIDHWKKIAGDLPLPLGVSAVKKSLGPDVMQRLSDLQKKSIQYGLTHFDTTKHAVMRINPVLAESDVDRYLAWYVNGRTLDIGPDGKTALELLFKMAAQKKLLDHSVQIEIV